MHVTAAKILIAQLQNRRRHKGKDRNRRRSKSLPAAGVEVGEKKNDGTREDDDAHDGSGQSDTTTNAHSCSGNTSECDETMEKKSVQAAASKAAQVEHNNNCSARQNLLRKVRAWCASIMCEMYHNQGARQGTVSAHAQKSFAMVRQRRREKAVAGTTTAARDGRSSLSSSSEKNNSSDRGRAIEDDAQAARNTQLQELDRVQPALAPFVAGSEAQMRNQSHLLRPQAMLTLADYLQSRGLSQSVRYGAIKRNKLSLGNGSGQDVNESQNAEPQSNRAIVGSPSRVAAAMRRLRALDVRRQDSSSASSESPPLSDTESGVEFDANAGTVADSRASECSTAQLQVPLDDATGQKNITPPTSAAHRGELDNYDELGRLGADSERQGLNLGFGSLF